jgi:hypothetical protein
LLVGNVLSYMFALSFVFLLDLDLLWHSISNLLKNPRSKPL